MALVFQYGSNASESRLNSPERLDGAAEFFGTGYTQEKYELGFTIYSYNNGCVSADMIPDGNTHIWGVLYDIPCERIFKKLAGGRKSLDAIEGESGNYERVSIKVVSPADRRTFNAITYVVRNRVDKLKTSQEYVGHILSGLTEKNISQDYIDYVCRRIVANNPALEDFVARWHS